MPNLDVTAEIAIVDADATHSIVLQTLLNRLPEVKSVSVFSSTDDAKEAFDSRLANSLIIDPYSVGSAIGFISWLRSEHRNSPICLFSDAERLASFPGIPPMWRQRFLDHYFKLPKELPLEVMELEARRLVAGFRAYLFRKLARARLRELNYRLELEPQAPVEFTHRDREAVEVAEKALEVADALAHSGSDRLVAGWINATEMTDLTKDTLDRLTGAWSNVSRVTIGVLLLGSALVVSSFIAALITKRWETVSFGGLGLGGIIAALITNPLRTLEMRAPRLVQVQAVYLAFLAQFRILLVRQHNPQVDPFAICAQLREAVKQCVDDLQKCGK